jgi:hypothetical protein
MDRSVFKYRIFLIILLVVGSIFPSELKSQDLIRALEKVSSTPTDITFSNDLEIENKGGHIQGVQGISHQGNHYYVLSGSSSEYSYYSVVKVGQTNFVISHNKILERPFKHAGGFQIHNNLMAIGVEDNDKKNRSKVFIFLLENPENPPEQPVAIIERIGTEKRATAGCVAITGIDDRLLIIVGDWDTKHLDFYVIEKKLLGKDPAALQLEYSMDMAKTDKTEWVDESWLSYQNINLISEAGTLYLAGMTTNDGVEILDLFEVINAEMKVFSLKKIYSKNFGVSENTKFRWGAGLYMAPDQKLQILSTPENILSENIIHMYE